MQLTQIAPAPQLNHPARWLALFGPGAIVASLTIGSGELVFSSRGGALFGYPLLGPFLLICLMKWALVFATARHMILTGAHPFQRWMDCPGPSGWLPIVFLLLAVVAFPIWVGFHAGTVGTLLASLFGTEAWWGGSTHFVWGLVTLLLVMGLVWTGGYQRLERVQLAVVGIMLACVTASLAWLRPDPLEMLAGMLGMFQLEYPGWVAENLELRDRPLWVELATYVGVIGGSGYDYLAYVSFLRDKHWGAAAGDVLDADQLTQLAADPHHAARRWIVAPLVDASLSFLIVFLFSAVFLTCGTLVLRPLQQVPSGSDLLTLQARFVAAGTPWLRPLYFVGALLAMLGTLYGTIEVAPCIARELQRALGGRQTDPRSLHRQVTGWVGLGAALLLIGSLATFRISGQSQPPGLIAILTPANLFTGVLACGLISWLAVWSDLRWLPRSLRMPWWLQAANWLGGALFCARDQSVLGPQSSCVATAVGSHDSGRLRAGEVAAMGVVAASQLTRFSGGWPRSTRATSAAPLVRISSIAAAE